MVMVQVVGTSSGALIVRITVSGGTIQSFGLTVGSDTTIPLVGGVGYTFGTVNLGGSGFTFSDSGLSGINMGGSGGVIEVVISF